MTPPLDKAALLALVAEARAKADAATPGPWRTLESGTPGESPWSIEVTQADLDALHRGIAIAEIDSNDREGMGIDVVAACRADAAFIADARTRQIALADAVEALVQKAYAPVRGGRCERCATDTDVEHDPHDCLAVVRRAGVVLATNAMAERDALRAKLDALVEAVSADEIVGLLFAAERELQGHGGRAIADRLMRRLDAVRIALAAAKETP